MTAPLRGKKVVVTRPRHQAQILGEELRARGAEIIYLPVIEISEPESWDPFDRAVAGLQAGSYEWLAFTSANGARAFLDRVGGGAAGIARGASVAAVGERTAAVLRRAGLEVALVPVDSRGLGLAGALGQGEGTILLPRGQDAPSELVDALRARGWEVDEVASYRTRPAEPPPEALAQVRAGSFDAVAFASPSAVAGFVGHVPDLGSLELEPPTSSRPVVVCIGPTTARAARAAGLRVDTQARDRSPGGIADALAAAFSAREA